MTDSLNRIRLVLMDIDGTLIQGHDDTIDHVVNQLRKLKPLGIHFSIATGRTLFGAQRLFHEMSAVGMRMPPVIAYNGAVVAWPDDTPLLHRFTLPKEVITPLLLEFQRKGLSPYVYTCSDRLDVLELERVYGHSQSNLKGATDFNGMPIVRVDSFDTLPFDDVVAILGEQHTQEFILRTTTEQLVSEFGSVVRITSSGNRFVEVGHPSSSKASAMQVLCRQWAITPRDVMAIGDNFNDLEMLEASGFGVAVANAPSAVKAVAMHSCKRNAAEGVIEALRLLLDSIRRDRIESRVREGYHDPR